MGLFEKLFKSGNRQAGMAPMPEDMMMQMDAGLPGPGGIDPMGGVPQMDPLMAANSPTFSNYRDQQEMIGLAAITLDNDQIIEDFASQLRGYKKKAYPDPATGEIRYKHVKTGERFCNDKGVNELTAELAMRLSKVWILTNIPKKESSIIDRMMLITSEELAKKFVQNVENWEMDRTRMDTVCSQMVTITWANIMRGYDEGERTKMYSKNIQMTTAVPHMMPQEKKSILGV